MLVRGVVLAVAAWLAAAGSPACAADRHREAAAATGEPTPIGHLSHDVGSAGYVYTQAPGMPGVPPEPGRRHKPYPAIHRTHAPVAGRAVSAR